MYRTQMRKEGDRVLAKKSARFEGVRGKWILTYWIHQRAKVYGWYSFVLKGLGVFP